MSVYQNQNLKAKAKKNISIRLLSWSLFTELIEKSARNINVLQKFMASSAQMGIMAIKNNDHCKYQKLNSVEVQSKSVPKSLQ
jgi:hypothetical protein